MTDLRELLKRCTPGPWDAVPANEHHGPYVTSEFGLTLCDLYCMGAPERSAGMPDPMFVKAVPHIFMHEMAGPNAALIAQAPTLAQSVLDLTEENARLMEALKPFAEIELPDGPHNKNCTTEVFVDCVAVLAARAALSAGERKGD